MNVVPFCISLVPLCLGQIYSSVGVMLRTMMCFGDLRMRRFMKNIFPEFCVISFLENVNCSLFACEPLNW